MEEDVNDVKWDIDMQGKTITFDDNVVLKITKNDYIGKNISEYVNRSFFLWGFLKFIFLLLFWISLIILLSMACESNKHPHDSYIPYIVVAVIAIVFKYIGNLFQKEIDKENEIFRKKFYESDTYKKAYYETKLKPNILYRYLKKIIPIYAALKDKHQLIESNNFASDNMDVLMSKVYIEAFLLDATGIIINQNNISNEVSGYVRGNIKGYTTSSGKGSVSGYTYGNTQTNTTHHCHVTFVK